MLGGFARFSVCVLALLLALPAAAQEFALRVIVEENRRTEIGIFRNVSVQWVTRQGQILFLADRESVFDANDQALFLWINGRIVRLIGRGDRVPGGEIRGVLAAVAAPRNSAARAFVATVRDAEGVERTGLYLSARRQLLRVVQVGEALEGGRFLEAREGSLQINGDGEVLFLAHLDTNESGTFEPGTDASALYLFTGGRLRRLAAEGETRFGGTVRNLALGGRALNDRSRVTWAAAIETEAGIENVIVVADRDRARNVVRSGQRAPGGRILGPRGPVLNERGNVAFVAELDVNQDLRFDVDRDTTGAFLFRPEGFPATLTLLRSDRLERGNTLILATPVLNDFNEALVAVQVDTNLDGVLDAEDREAFYRAATSGVTALARGGRRVRFGAEIRGGELRLGDGLMNNDGAAAIGGFVDGDESGDFTLGFDERLILYSVGDVPLFVARDRQTLGVAPLGRGQLLNLRGPDALTDGNIIVFTADIDRNFDGRIDPRNEGRAILLAIPPRG